MSDNDGNLRDPIIDTLEESDDASRHEEEQHSDNVHMGSFNGDSLPTSGSPFKKGYGGGSLGEASVDSLVDEPLPIESVNLSPFRIETIHNSPLSSRQKDPHTFSVSVPDSLPPHVMELDSPEHYGEKMDEPYDDSEFCIEKVPPVIKVPEDESFLIEGPSKGFPIEDTDEPLTVQDSLESILEPSPDNQKQKSDPSWTEEQPRTSPTGSLVTPSQADMFDTQEVDSSSTPSVSSVRQSVKEDGQENHTQQHSSEISNKLQKEEKSCRGIGEDFALDEKMLPLSDVEKHSRDQPSQPLESKRIYSSTESSSPVKRKRDNWEESSPHGKVIKKDRKEEEPEGGGRSECKEGRWVSVREKPEEADSDIEILDSESFSSANQSVEVVFDKKYTQCDTETVESQDLKLILTAATQPEEELTDVGHCGIEKESSTRQSQSLLSLPDSVSLTCNERVSSSSLEEVTTVANVESTLRPTQVELLCADREASSTQQTSQPNVKPLISFPLVQGKATSNSCNESTNNISSSNNNSSSNSYNDNFSNLKPESISTHVESNVLGTDSQKSIDPSASSDLAVSYPHFHTPSQVDEGSQGVEEEESMFVKISKATEKKKEETRHLELVKVKEKASFDYSSSLSSEENSKHNSPYEMVKSGDSNNSTPLCAINPTRYSQSTPISSQLVAGEPSTWLFSKISQEHATNSSDNGKTNIHKSNVSEGDSDDERKRKRESDTSNGRKSKVKINWSTPNVSNGSNISPSSPKDEPASDITTVSNINSTVNSSQNTNHVESKMDTIELESDNIQNAQELRESGWLNLGFRQFTFPLFECWENPTTKERVYTIEGENEVIKENTPFSFVLRYANLSKSGSSKESRISDISSISKSTISSGYLGDRSSSLSNQEGGSKLESTRLSMASVCPISPPQSSLQSVVKPAANSGAKTIDDDDAIFVLPPPMSLPVQTKKALGKSSPIPDIPVSSGGKLYEISSSDTSSSDNARVLRSRGRPRGRGRGRGRGAEKVTIPPAITEEGKIGLSQSESSSERDEEYGDKFFSLLPDFLQERMRKAQVRLTEDEEELFILQKNQISEKDQKSQFDEICRKVRIAKIEPGSLVFARYFDKNYYSAIIQEPAKEDRWKVQYNLDNLENDVREMYILPTDKLPKGTSCYVMKLNQKFSEPGVVKSHIYQDGVLLHVIELQTGQVIKSTHSHIILTPNVAGFLNESRLNFHSMIASPGGDVSLNNIVAGSRRRETPSQQKLHQVRKADDKLDTTDETNESKQEISKIKIVPTAFSDTTSTESELYYTAIEVTPKSSRKKVLSKSPATSKTRKSRTKKTLLKQLLEETLETKDQQASSSSSSPLPLDKIGVESGKYSSKKSKGTPQSKSSKKKLSEDTQTASSKSKESLLNPVVELIQLQEVKSSPKSISKKRGRKPGSATKNPKKVMKLEEDKSSSDVEDIAEVDPLLGPLPPPGCQIFNGYTILITHAIKIQNAKREDKDPSFSPLNKDFLADQIISGGGKVVETFEEAYRELQQFLQTKRSSSKDDISNKKNKQILSDKTLPASESPSRILCLSNDYCRTAKYIQCLTVGIPLVQTNWVVSSIKGNECLNWTHFLLPAGYSLMTGNTIEQIFSYCFEDITSVVGKITEIVQGDKVFLASSSNPEFGELWLHLLTVANAVVFRMPPKGGKLQRLIDRRTTFVIADHTIPDDELKRATEVNVPVVSSEWFIQSLITGCKLQFDAQPQFKYNYKATSSSSSSSSHQDKTSEEGDSDR